MVGRSKSEQKIVENLPRLKLCLIKINFMEAKFLLLLRLKVIYKFINCLENFSANISSHGSLWKGTKRDWLKIPASSQFGKMLIENFKSSQLNMYHKGAI